MYYNGYLGTLTVNNFLIVSWIGLEFCVRLNLYIYVDVYSFYLYRSWFDHGL